MANSLQAAKQLRVAETALPPPAKKSKTTSSGGGSSSGNQSVSGDGSGSTILRLSDLRTSADGGLAWAAIGKFDTRYASVERCAASDPTQLYATSAQNIPRNWPEIAPDRPIKYC